MSKSLMAIPIALLSQQPQRAWWVIWSLVHLLGCGCRDAVWTVWPRGCCSTLAAMVVSNSVTEEEVDWDTMSGEASGESWKTLVIKDSPNKAAQILEDRYTQREAQTEQQMFCVSL